MQLVWCLRVPGMLFRVDKSDVVRKGSRLEGIGRFFFGGYAMVITSMHLQHGHAITEVLANGPGNG